MGSCGAGQRSWRGTAGGAGPRAWEPQVPLPPRAPRPRNLLCGRIHLSLAELQHLGQTLPLGRGEVFLGLKLLLQLDGLVVGKPNLAALPFMQRPLQERAPEQGFTCGQQELRLVTTMERPGPAANKSGRGDTGEHPTRHMHTHPLTLGHNTLPPIHLHTETQKHPK